MTRAAVEVCLAAKLTLLPPAAASLELQQILRATQVLQAEVCSDQRRPAPELPVAACSARAHPRRMTRAAVEVCLAAKLTLLPPAAASLELQQILRATQVLQAEVCSDQR